MWPTAGNLKILLRTVLTGVIAFVLVSHAAKMRSQVSARDSVAYWAAGRLLLHQQNPYDAKSVLGLERQQGYTETSPLVLRTPPWSLWMVLPLGFVDAFWAWVIWIALCLGALVGAVRLCWKIYGDNGRPPTVFGLVAYTFAPVPACLVAGQMGLVLLLGITVFLLCEPDHPFLAGAVLVLPFVKPHLLSLFWVALLLRLLVGNRRTVAIGFATALAVAVGIALMFDPAVFQDYCGMLYKASVGHEFIPALSGVLRLLFFHSLFWVQFIPMSIGLVWCARFCYRNRSNWDWRYHGLALMVVSVLTTPYAWLTDEVVLLPAVLQAVLWVYAIRDRIGVKTGIVLTIFGSMNVLLLLILYAKIPFATGIYFWSSLVWFAWYFYGRSFSVAPTAKPTRGLVQDL